MDIETNKVFVARQMILDRHENLYGYELLFRDSHDQKMRVIDDVKATAHVLTHTLNSIGTHKILGEKKGFINVNEQILKTGICESLDRDRFIFEILENTQVDAELVDKIRELHFKNYMFALDDFIFNQEMIKKFEPLFSICFNH